MRKERAKKPQRPVFFIVFVALFIVALAFLLHPQPAKSCANSISCISDLSGRYKSEPIQATFLGNTLLVPPKIADPPYKITVLGSSTDQKKIEVDLTTQQLSAFEGDKKVFTFPVSTGKWYATPTGTFHIWIKLRYTLMAGGDKAIGTYYYLPNVPYTMFFYNDQVPKTMGYGIHGTYWHNNFGHPMSHGCINMKTEDAEKIYNWADPPTQDSVTTATPENQGTTIVIYGETPKE